MESFDITKNNQRIKEAMSGSTTAFAHLYEEIYQDLYRFALYTMKDPHEAEDVVSESVLIGYDKIETLRKAESFKSWLFQITGNQCRKRFASKQKVRPDDDPETFDAVLLQDIGESLGLQEVFCLLNDEDRFIVALSVFGKYNSREIGRLMDLNSATVRSKLSRAYGKLRAMLGETD